MSFCIMFAQFVLFLMHALVTRSPKYSLLEDVCLPVKVKTEVVSEAKLTENICIYTHSI